MQGGRYSAQSVLLSSAGRSALRRVFSSLQQGRGVCSEQYPSRLPSMPASMPSRCTLMYRPVHVLSGDTLLLHAAWCCSVGLTGSRAQQRVFLTHSCTAS